MKILVTAILLVISTSAMADIRVPGSIYIDDAKQAELVYKSMDVKEEKTSARPHHGPPRPGEKMIPAWVKTARTDQAMISCTKVQQIEGYSYNCVGTLSNRDPSSVKKSGH